MVLSAVEGLQMGVGWGGPADTGMSYSSFDGLRSAAVLAALWASDTTMDYESFSGMGIGVWLQMLPKDDPVRHFYEMPEVGTLTKSQVVALAARLAEVAYQLHETRRAHDDCAYSVFWLLRECSVAAYRGQEISWG
jgi:hypothetical protein